MKIFPILVTLVSFSALVGWYYYFSLTKESQSLTPNQLFMKRRFDEATALLNQQLTENALLTTIRKYYSEQLPSRLTLLEQLAVLLLSHVPRQQSLNPLQTKQGPSLSNTTLYPPVSNQRPRYLCSSFLSWTPEKLALLQGNVEKVGSSCEWLLVVYHHPNPQQTIAEMKDELTYHYNLSVDSIRIEVPPLRQNPHFLSYYRQKCQSQFHQSIDGVISGRQLPASSFRKYSGIPFLPFNELHHLCDLISIDAEDSSVIVSEKSRDRLYPKVLLLLVTLDYLSSYDYLWLLDDDADLQEFNFTDFTQIHSQGIDPQLVSQPLIKEKKPYFPYLSVEEWQSRAASYRSLPKSSLTGYIEIQAPMLDSHYLRWYLLAFVIPLFAPLNLLAVDWGFDDVFCRSSYLFAHPDQLQVLLTDYDRIFNEQELQKLDNTIKILRPYETHQTKKKTISRLLLRSSKSSSSVSNLTLTHCSVILGSNHSAGILHRDHQDIVKRLGSFSIRELYSTKMRSFLFQHYPHFYLPGIFSAANPFVSCTSSSQSQF